MTTNQGKTRFNPNIYNSGKVCLSILGTWPGERGEQWSSAQTIESVLLSIQSLMSSNPYQNEPGFDNVEKDEPRAQAYVAKIRHETIRISVVQRLEQLMGIENGKVPSIYQKIRTEADSLLQKSGKNSSHKESALNDDPGTPDTDDSFHEFDSDDPDDAYSELEDQGDWDPFADLMKNRFLWYYDTYCRTMESAVSEQPDGNKFEDAEFEFRDNGMAGQFSYKSLIKRVEKLNSALEEERLSWKKEGAAQATARTQLATQLAFHFQQLSAKKRHTSQIDLKLPDPNNPFVWNIAILGKPMTNLEGGIFNLVLSIPPQFPQQQPRVKFDTPIFHHRVSSRGYLCYFPEKPEEISSHLEAILCSIEDENPTFDPRAAVNPGAFALRWGGAEEKKFYSRKLRRSAQESCEA